MNPRNLPTVNQSSKTERPDDGPADDRANPIGLATRLGRYDLLGILGTGGMGVVFEARDPELDRSVAVKVMSSHSNRLDGVGAARLRREGVTMARLTHPNVIRVYDVGVHDGRAFVAMELIRGCTLAAWLVRAPRKADDIVSTFLLAGRGLAAAHDAGLVHRDFKPQNVLVGDDGRVLVTDFGLARVVGNDDVPSGDLGSSPTSPEVTQAGEIVGTPAYMAPEQCVGMAVDARADQFSFCVALWRALTYADDTEITPGGRARSGWLRPISGVPPRLRAALKRGIEAEPERRFESMHELLARLEPRPSRGAARWAAVAGVALVAGVASRFLTGGGAVPDPCPAPSGQLAAAWSSAREDAMKAHLQAVDPGRGLDRFGSAQQAIGPFVQSWGAMHVEACKDTRVRGKQSDQMLDRRMVCLDRALVELDESVGAVLRASDRPGVDEAIVALAGLGSLAPCADIAALTEKLPPPTDPVRRSEFDALSRQIAAINARGRIQSQRVDVRAQAGEIIERARRLGHPAVLGDALWSRALVELESEANDAALVTLREHVAVAAAAHDDLMVAEAWTRMVSVLAGPLSRVDEAEGLVTVATAAVARAGDTPQLRARLRIAEARIAMRKGDRDRAQALLDEGRAALEGADAAGADVGVLLVVIRLESGRLHSNAQRWKEAAAAFHSLLPVIEARLGPDHPEMVTASFNQGVALLHLGDLEAALVAFRESARIGEARMSASPRLVSILDAVGTTLVRLERFEEALPYLERSTEMAHATMSPDDPRLAAPVGDLGSALLSLERFAEARRYIEEHVAIGERVGKPSGAMADALYNLADLEVQTGHCRDAFSPLERALALFEELRGKDSDEVSSTVTLLAVCQVEARQWGEALASSDRVLASSHATAEQRARARSTRARALAGPRRR